MESVIQVSLVFFYDMLQDLQTVCLEVDKAEKAQLVMLSFM